jgi:hypothetical protein
MAYAVIAIGVALVAAVSALLLVRRHANLQERVLKAVFFGLYFWGLVFLQLIVVALVYEQTR